MMINKSTYIYILTKPIVINHINKRSMATLVFLSSQIQPTYLTRLQAICFSKRSMWKAISKMIGSSPKLLKTLETKVPETSVALAKKVALTVENSLLPVPLQYSPKPFQYPLVYNEPYLSGVVQAIIPKELSTPKNILVPHKISETLCKELLPAPLIYTPKDFRFWILDKEHKYDISGLASLTKKERNILQYRYSGSANISLENHVYYINYAKMICLIKAQIFLYCFQDKHSLNSVKMLNVLQKIYSIPVAALPWLKNKAFKELYEQKAAAMIQHFLVMTYGNTKFNLSLNDPYIVSDTKTGSILSVVELFTAYKTCMPSILKDLNLSLRLITPGVDFLKTGDIFNSNESLKQINQKNSDCLVYELVIESGGIKVITYYRDVKMDYKGPLKGYLSFKALVSIDFMSLKTFINDLLTSIDRLCKGSYNIETKAILEDAFNFFSMKGKDLTNTNVKAIYHDVKQHLIDLTFDKTLTKDNIHFSVIIEFEKNSDPRMSEIITAIEQDPNLLQYLDPEIHYPRYTKISFISWKEYYELSLKGIRAHLPAAEQESILENYIPFYVNLEKQLTLL